MTKEQAHEANEMWLDMIKQIRAEAQKHVPMFDKYNGHHAIEKYNKIMAKADKLEKQRLEIIVPNL